MTCAEVFAQGVPFGWHGTRTPEAFASISHDNLDPARRSGQACGPGEYCAVQAATSFSYCASTMSLFVFFIIKNCTYYKLSTHYVINNPSPSEMYMVPILIATFNQQAPLNITCNQTNQNQNQNQTSPLLMGIQWEWHNDSGWVCYGSGQSIGSSALVAIEHSYTQFKQGSAAASLTLSFTRLNDKGTDNYLIDFTKRNQINTRTGYARQIRRVVNGIESWN